jgi:hypothetical protein
VPTKHEQDASLGQWVRTQRKNDDDKRKCDQTERNFWTKSDSPGNMLPLQPALLRPMQEVSSFASFHTLVRQITAFLTLVLFPLVCVELARTTAVVCSLPQPLIAPDPTAPPAHLACHRLLRQNPGSSVLAIIPCCPS